MKILITTGIFPPDIGGPATYVPLMAEALSRRGHDVRVLTTCEPESDPADKFPFEVRRLNRRAFLPLRFLRTFRAVLRHGRESDVIFSNGVFFESALAARLLRKPLVMKIVGDKAWETASRWGWTQDSFHDFQNRRQSRKTEWLKKFRSLPPRMADRVIVPSGYLRQTIESWGTPKRKATVVYNAAPSPSPTSAGAKQEPFHIVMVGRLIPLKQVDAVLRVLSTISGARMTVIGDGAERSSLENLAGSLGLTERVVFAGVQTPEQVAQTLRGSHVLVLYSTHEGFPHVALEAMAQGVPVIGAQSGGIPEVVRHKENGLLVSAREEQSLRDALTRLMKDGDLWRALSDGARRTVESFSRDGMVSETEKILASAAAPRASWKARFRRLGNLAQRLCGLAAAPSVPPAAKLDMARLWLLRHFAKCGHEYALSVGPGFVFLDPCHDADMATMEEIFIMQQYAADFRHAIVIDLGAHKGCFTLYAALRRADWILAFEPEARNRAALSRTAASLRRTRARCLVYPEAVAASAGEVDFYVTGESWSHSFFPRDGRGKLKTVRVKTRTLDDIIAEARRAGGASRRIIVKMDVEGAEWDALAAVSDGALAEVAEMFVEVHPRPPHTTAGLADRLERTGLHAVPCAFDNILHVRRDLAPVSAAPAQEPAFAGDLAAPSTGHESAA